MVLINGSKYACDACIRGHRASSCAHTSRQLQPVRPKGRPSSQCNTCKAKRVAGSFHGKCHCAATSDSRSSSSRGVSSEEEGNTTSNAEATAGGESSRGRYSLEALMNPCRCKTTGICTCCKTDSRREKAQGQDLLSDSGAACCDNQDCCSDAPNSTCLTSSQVKPAKSCCSGKGNKEAGAPAALFPAQPGMTRNEVEAIVSPPCQCGENCTCPGCLRKDGQTSKEAAENEECPDKCLTCSACAFGLTRPSGIDVIDEWMENDIQGKEQYTRGTGSDDLPSKRIKVVAAERPHAPMPRPPLPPFANASAFYSSHFLDPERRKYFAEQMQATASNKPQQHFSDAKIAAEEELGFGVRLQGETDEEWQIRHGFYYLTPDAIRIFDSTRKFREERQQQEERDDEIERSATPSESVAPSESSVISQELSDLRKRALSARKKPSGVPLT